MLQKISTVVTPTQFDAYSGKEFVDPDGLSPGFYVVATGPEGWSGANVYYSSDGGTTWTFGGVCNIQGNFGLCNNTLTDGAVPLSVDLLDTLDVSIYRQGLLSSCSVNDLANGVNGALVGGEMVSYLNVAAGTDPLEFDLTTITRGQRGTNTSGHMVGERFWNINNAVTRVAVAASLVGHSILVVALSFGQSVTDANVSPISLTVAHNNFPYATPGDVSNATPSIVTNGDPDAPSVVFHDAIVVTSLG